MPSEFATGRGPLRKIEGKTFPIVAEVVVRLTNHKELYSVDGKRFTNPTEEERLEISIEKDGKQVAIGRVVLADVMRKLDEDDCELAPIDDDEAELAFLKELREGRPQPS